VTTNFDLEKALSGKYKIKTKHNKNVRIICHDRKGDLPIVALIEEPFHDEIEELIQSYYLNGNHRLFTPSDFDLMLEEI
jgi:hypothetical protein